MARHVTMAMPAPKPTCVLPVLVSGQTLPIVPRKMFVMKSACAIRATEHVRIRFVRMERRARRVIARLVHVSSMAGRADPEVRAEWVEWAEWE